MIQTQCIVAQTKCNSLHCLLRCICNATAHCITFIALALEDKRGNERKPEWPTLANGSSTTRECGEDCNSFFSPFFFILIFPWFSLPNCWSSTSRECWRLVYFSFPPKLRRSWHWSQFLQHNGGDELMKERGRSDPDWLMGTLPQENNTKTGEKSSQRWNWWGGRDDNILFSSCALQLTKGAKPTK